MAPDAAQLAERPSLTAFACPVVVRRHEVRVGIDPGAIGWVTVDLPRGAYELVCNLPGHYAAGMYTELRVS